MSTIPQLRALRQRKGERSMQQAKYGITADPSITLELRDLETVIHLMEMIDTHRANLNILLSQRAQHGLHVPTHIITQINSERESISTLRLQCSRLGYPVDTHEVDADELTIDPPPVRAPSAPPVETQLDRIEKKLDRLLALYDR